MMHPYPSQQQPQPQHYQPQHNQVELEVITDPAPRAAATPREHPDQYFESPTNRIAMHYCCMVWCVCLVFALPYTIAMTPEVLILTATGTFLRVLAIYLLFKHTAGLKRNRTAPPPRTVLAMSASFAVNTLAVAVGSYALYEAGGSPSPNLYTAAVGFTIIAATIYDGVVSFLCCVCCIKVAQGAGAHCKRRPKPASVV